jgi:chromate transport protein ChrA
MKGLIGPPIIILIYLVSIYDLISRLNEGMSNDISSGVRIFVAVAGRQRVTQAARAQSRAISGQSRATTIACLFRLPEH